MEPQRLRRRKENLAPVTPEPGFSRGAEGAAEKIGFPPSQNWENPGSGPCAQQKPEGGFLQHAKARARSNPPPPNADPEIRAFFKEGGVAKQQVVSYLQTRL